MPGVMIQGTGSNVGKSMLVAGLCRAARLRGLNVRPFKPQNMSNNAAVTSDGGEIGRAQALQAMACGVPAHTDMNPILLKPESDRGAAVIVHGRHTGTMKARDYSAHKPQLLQSVLESYKRLDAISDLVIVEGAGSPAEINLRAGDIANMGFAQAANVPVILAGDIDRGGVIAQMSGTKAVLDPADEALIAGFIINKFRGDPSLFDDGYAYIERETGWQGFGVVPYFEHASQLPAEDALDIKTQTYNGKIKIGCLRLSRIANFDDLDPLSLEDDVSLTMIEAHQAIPGDLDLLIIPGTKSTIADMAFIRKQGWDIDIHAHVRRGGKVLGICGGYQILGRKIFDPEHIESTQAQCDGLGLLDIETVMRKGKSVTLSDGVHVPTGVSIRGYEIHIGQTTGADSVRPFARIGDRNEGAISADGAIMGTYLHGAFSADAFRQNFLQVLDGSASSMSYDARIEEVLDLLAAHLEKHLNIDAILKLAR